MSEKLDRVEVSAIELAEWLETQGDKTWWAVDGDPWLQERVAFPCLAKDLAHAIRDRGKAVLAVVPPDRATPKELKGDLDAITFEDPPYRMLGLSWQDQPEDFWEINESPPLMLTREDEAA